MKHMQKPLVRKTICRCIRMSGPQGSLEEWGRSLNELTQLKKFRELGTLMYDNQAGPSES